MGISSQNTNTRETSLVYLPDLDPVMMVVFKKKKTMKSAVNCMTVVVEMGHVSQRRHLKKAEKSVLLNN